MGKKRILLDIDVTLARQAFPIQVGIDGRLVTAFFLACNPSLNFNIF